MDINGKVQAILSFLENRSVGNPDEASEIIRNSGTKERELFTSAVLETLTNGDMSYDEAVARVQASDFSAQDKSIILAYVGDFESKVNLKTASDKTEVPMDDLMKEVNALKAVLPHYGAWVETQLKQSCFTQSDKPKDDPMHAGVMKKDEQTVTQGIAAEKSRRNEMDKATDPNKRTVAASDKTAGAESHTSKPVTDLRESERLKNHSEYDQNVLPKELAKAKEGENEGKKQNTEDQKLREEYLRAAEKMDIKFSNASNSWVISAKATGEPIVIASIEDITAGKPIEGEALAELKSDKMGEIIMQDIKDNGLEVAAMNLLGDTFEKLAAEDASRVKTASVKVAEIKSKVAQLKDIHASLKVSLGKVASLKPFAALLNKVAVGLEGIENGMTPPAPDMATEIDVAGPEAGISGIADDLSVVNESAMGLGAVSDDPKVNEAGQALLSAIEDPNPDSANAAAEALIDAAGGAEEGTKELEEPKAPPAPKKEEPKEEKKDEPKEEPKEEKKDNPFEKKEAAGVAVKTSGILNALKKLGAKENKKAEGDYDVTKKDNFMADFDHNKGNVEMYGKKFMNLDTLRKGMEAALNAKATGKLATIIPALIAETIKVAKEDGGVMKVEEYYKLAYGPEYGKALTHEYSEGEVKKEWEANDKDVLKNNNAYASGASKMKLAVKATQAMVKKGLLGMDPTEADIDAQVDTFMKMPEETMAAVAETTERIARTTELEDGRFKVAALPEADENGNLVVGYIDNRACAKMTGEEISANGLVTKANLVRAMAMLKTAFKEKLFEPVLSDGKIGAEDGVDLSGLNVGQGKERPIAISRTELL